MADYISKNEALNLIMYNDKVGHYADERYENVVYETACRISDVVANMPAADVQPTKKVDEYRSLLEECERKLRYLLECEIENSTSVIEVKSLINKIQSSLKGSEQNV